jgi:hypothetical protein
MKTEPQNAAPANPETEGSHLEAEGRDDSNPRERQELPTNTGRDRNGWRAYFPAAVRKTLRRRDDESRSRETFEKLQARFVKTLLVLILAFF